MSIISKSWKRKDSCRMMNMRSRKLLGLLEGESVPVLLCLLSCGEGFFSSQFCLYVSTALLYGQWQRSSLWRKGDQSLVGSLALDKAFSASDGTHIAPASLSRHKVEPYYRETPYSDNDNASLAASLWHAIDIDSGVIALSDDYVASKGLLTAQRFPWDAKKGIYIVHGYHNLHCLVKPFTPIL